MAKFSFEARAANGKSVRGEVEAANDAEARVKIRAQRLIPTRVVPFDQKLMGIKKQSQGKGIKPRDLQILTRQLATLLSSGIPILQSIDTLSQSSRNQSLVYALKTAAADISRGKRLAEALAEHPLIFNRFFVNMVRAGEESGNLDLILSKLAVYIEKSVKIVQKVKGALLYPCIILAISAIVVIGLLVFVIPKFQSLFSQFGGELPALTQFVVAISNGFMKYWWLLLAIVVFTYYSVTSYYKTDEGKKKFDKFFIDLPLFGQLIQKSAIARFTSTLSTLLGSGVSIMEAMDISAKTVGNNVVETLILKARDSISEGKSLTVPFSKEKYIPSMVNQMISIGEQTGTLEQMLAKIAEFYEDEVDIAATSLTTAIEPILMVVLGCVIAFLVIAMYLPIFSIAGQVGH